jgi:hypothetical protein
MYASYAIPALKILVCPRDYSDLSTVVVQRITIRHLAIQSQSIQLPLSFAGLARDDRLPLAAISTFVVKSTASAALDP